jgi:hypothetical protein
VNSLEACREVLQTNAYSLAKPGFFHTLVGEFLGVGLLFSVGEQHKRLRRIIAGKSGIVRVTPCADPFRAIVKTEYTKAVSDVCVLLS